MSAQDWIDVREPVWRDALRGVSLVAEMDIDDNELERAETIFGGTLTLSAPRAVARRYPAFFAICLTSAGSRSWQEGTFYAKVAKHLDVSTEKLTEATREFPSCLSRLGLPTFSEAEGMRWVTPVLLHGAVPLDHLDELLELMQRRWRRDTAMTGDTFVEWVRLSSAALAGQPKALTRFLEHGGDFAPDYVDRVMDIVNGAESSLPRRTTERLAEFLAEMPQLRASRGRGVDDIRPSVGLSSDGSVILSLPPAKPLEGRSLEWRVTAGGSTEVVELSVPYVEGRTTTDGHVLDISAPVRELLIENPRSSTTLPLVRREDPMLVFDGRQKLVPPTSPIPAGNAIVMWATALGHPRLLDRTELEGEERDVPFGWDGWRAISARLTAGTTIVLPGGHPRRVAGADRARIELGEPLQGVTTRDHQPVYADRPRVVLPSTGSEDAWLVVVSDAEGNEVERVVADGKTLAVPTTTEAVVGEYAIEIRGPLGRGLKQRVAVIEEATLDFRPSRRTLENNGGLSPSSVTISRRLEMLAAMTLAPNETQKHVVIRGIPFLVEPPHIAVSLVTNGLPKRWETDRLRLTPEDLTRYELGVRGLDPTISAHLVLRSAAMTQVIPPRRRSKTFSQFPLSGLTDHVAKAGAGTLWLGPDPLVPVAELRPEQLSSSASLTDDGIEIEGFAASELEVALYRLAVPWESGIVSPLHDGRAELAEELRFAGPLRVEVRVANEWAPAPTDVLPAQGVDVYDIDAAWDPLSVGPGTRQLSAVLAGSWSGDTHEEIQPESIARAIQVIGNPNIRRNIPYDRRSTVDALVRRGGAHTIAAVLDTVASENAIVLALVRAGLTAAPADALAQPDLAEQLMQRSPVAGLLAASAYLRDREQRRDGLGLVVAEALGHEIELLWAGDLQPDAQLCRFEPYFLSKPHLLKTLYDQLAPVPAMLLDADSATVAAHELWEARAALTKTAKRGMAVVSDCRRHVEATDASLLPLIDARLTQDGALALPVVSIAVALIARLAAHGDTKAALISAKHQEHHDALARHAPHITTFDLVRADAAVTGEHA